MKIFLMLFYLNEISLATFNLFREWEEYKIKYRKDYNSFENLYRKTIWMTNRNFIRSHNLRYNQQLVSYKLEVNQFTDLTMIEIAQIFGPSLKPAPMVRKKYFVNSSSRQNRLASLTEFDDVISKEVPESIDWRTLGAITPIKNQGIICNVGWAFASLAALESHIFLKNQEFPPELSAQNLIDCVNTTENSLINPNPICNNNMQTPWDAFDYIIRNENINTEAEYPYQNGKYGKCRYNSSVIGAKLSAIRSLPEGNDERLKEIIGTVGPVVIGIDARSFRFIHYSSGIYDEPPAFGSSRYLRSNHFVNVIGYGTISKNDSEIMQQSSIRQVNQQQKQEQKDFWILKNSFGNSWGENGYMRLVRKKTRPITVSALYPIV